MTPTGRARPGGGFRGLLPFVGRRAVAQGGLLAAVLAVLVAGCVLVGTSALLLTGGREAATDATLSAAEPADVQVEVTFRLSTTDQSGAVAEASGALSDAVAPMDPELSLWLTSAVRAVVGTPVQAYLAAATDIDQQAELLTGRWPSAAPAGPLEVAVPAVAARELGLEVGDALVLEETKDGMTGTDRPGNTAQPLTVVGVFRPTTLDGTGWDRDLLRGAGTASGWKPSPSTEGTGVHVVGPFVADAEALLTGEPAAVRASLLAVPRTVDVRPQDRASIRGALGRLQGDLRTALGDRTDAERVRAPLAQRLAATATRERVIGSVVLVVTLIGGALAAAALSLAGRLMAVRRAADTSLLAARGAGRGQLLARAATEAAAIAVLGAGLALPLAAQATARLSAMVGAPGRPAITGPVAAVVAAGAVVLAIALLWPAWRAADPQPRGRRSVRARAARWTVEATLVALAVGAYLQLRGHPMTGAAGADPVLVLAPTLCLVAGAALSLRLVPWVAGRADVRAAASRRLVLPLTAWEVSRRRHSAGAALLLVVAAAGSMFAVSLDRTWGQSLVDQADAAVGGDLEVSGAERAALAQELALAAATSGAVQPVVDREVLLGTAAGGVAPDARLLAFDATTAGDVLHSRLPGGRDWATLTAGLAPEDPAAPIMLPAGARSFDVTITGDIDDVRRLECTATFVVRGPGGAAAQVTGDAVPLDGDAHQVTVELPSDVGGAGGTLTVAAVGLDVSLIRDGPVSDEEMMPSDDTDTLEVSLDLGGATMEAQAGAEWTGTMSSILDDTPRGILTSTSGRGADGVVLTARGPVRTGFVAYAPTSFLLTAAPVPADVPVLLTTDLARSIAAEPGDLLALDLDDADVTARVVAVLPSFAALPHGATILADRETLARATVAQTRDAELADAWWVTGLADAEVDVAGRAVASGALGAVVTRADLAAAAATDPMRATLRAALLMLVVAGCALALAGTVVQTAATLRARAVDVARLLGMGMPARSVTAALVLEHALVSAVVVAAGVAIGAVGARFVAPLLVVSAAGAAPVPFARPVWPWPEQTAVVAVLFFGCAAVAAPVAASLVRRARAAHLRMDDAS